MALRRERAYRTASEGKHARGQVGRDRQGTVLQGHVWPQKSARILFSVCWELSGRHGSLACTRCYISCYVAASTQSFMKGRGRKGRKTEGEPEGGREDPSWHPHRWIWRLSPLVGAQGQTEAGLGGWRKLPSSCEHLLSHCSRSSGGPRWRWGLGSWEVFEKNRLLAASGFQVTDNNCQMVSLWSNKLPQNKEAGPAPEEPQSGQNTQAWKKLKVHERLNKAPRGDARG